MSGKGFKMMGRKAKKGQEKGQVWRDNVCESIDFRPSAVAVAPHLLIALALFSCYFFRDRPSNPPRIFLKIQKKEEEEDFSSYSWIMKGVVDEKKAKLVMIGRHFEASFIFKWWLLLHTRRWRMKWCPQGLVHQCIMDAKGEMVPP